MKAVMVSTAAKRRGKGPGTTAFTRREIWWDVLDSYSFEVAVACFIAVYDYAVCHDNGYYYNATELIRYTRTHNFEWDHGVYADFAYIFRHFIRYRTPPLMYTPADIKPAKRVYLFNKHSTGDSA